MLPTALAAGVVFFGILTWAAFELAGEALQRGRSMPATRLQVSDRPTHNGFRIFGLVCLAVALACAWGLGR